MCVAALSLHIPYSNRTEHVISRPPVLHTLHERTAILIEAATSSSAACALWHQVYILSPSEDSPLWHNKEINRKRCSKTLVLSSPTDRLQHIYSSASLCSPSISSVSWSHSARYLLAHVMLKQAARLLLLHAVPASTILLLPLFCRPATFRRSSNVPR